MKSTEEFIRQHQQNVKKQYMKSAREQARCEEMLHDIIVNGDQSGIENLKLLNHYQALVSEDVFLELEDMCINQINGRLLQ